MHGCSASYFLSSHFPSQSRGQTISSVYTRNFKGCSYFKAKCESIRMHTLTHRQDVLAALGVFLFSKSSLFIVVFFPLATLFINVTNGV